jgi:hypothetical protein
VNRSRSNLTPQHYTKNSYGALCHANVTRKIRCAQYSPRMTISCKCCAHLCDIRGCIWTTYWFIYIPECRTCRARASAQQGMPTFVGDQSWWRRHVYYYARRVGFYTITGSAAGSCQYLAEWNGGQYRSSLYLAVSFEHQNARKG